VFAHQLLDLILEVSDFRRAHPRCVPRHDRPLNPGPERLRRSYVCPHNFWTDATPIVNGILDRFYDQVTVDVCRNTLTKVEVSSGCELARNVALYDPLVQGGQAKGHPDEHNPLILARSLSWHPDNAVGYPATDCQDVDQLFPQTRGKSYRCIDTWLVNLSKL